MTKSPSQARDDCADDANDNGHNLAVHLAYKERGDQPIHCDVHAQDSECLDVRVQRKAFHSAKP